jgi:small subunit ribosomal protein S17e
MGRIKTQLMKRITLTLFKEHRGKFKKTFTENKEIVGKLVDFPSKKFRNIVAGYVTRLAISQKE